MNNDAPWCPCSHCHTPNRPGALFCQGCGHPLISASAAGVDRLTSIQQASEPASELTKGNLLPETADRESESGLEPVSGQQVQRPGPAVLDHPGEPAPQPFSAGGDTKPLSAVQPTSSENEPASERSHDFRLNVGFQSDAGRRRELDEDGILTMHIASMSEGVCRQTLGFFAVADGIGGHQSGEVASREALRALGQQVLERVFLRVLNTGREIPAVRLTEILDESIGKVNKHLYDLRQERENDMGTTLTAALLLGNLALIANVGDSRTYLWRDSALKKVTQDHSLIASLIAAEIEPPEAIYTHEQKSLIFRSLGDKPEVQVDVFPEELLPGDRLVLCCDGVWEMIRDEGIEKIMMAESHPQRACNQMVKAANKAGGEDNISVIIVAIEAGQGERVE